MIFNNRTYSVLIVSSSEKFSQTLTSLLPKYYCDPVRAVGSIGAAKREMLERRYDILIINSPLTDESGMSLAIDVSLSKNTICLMMVKAETYESANAKLVDRGVFTLAKPTSSSTLQLALNYCITARERLRIMESKSVSLEDKMKEIKNVNRAKWLLIENLNMSEEDAHHYIEKQAMNTGATKGEIANQIIQTYT